MQTFAVSLISVFKLYCRRIFSLFMITSSKRASLCSSYFANFKNVEMIKIRKWEDIKRCTRDVLEEFNNVNKVIMSEKINVTTFDDWWNLIIRLCITDINELRSEIITTLLAVNMKYESSFFNTIDEYLDCNDSINDLDLLSKLNCKTADELKTVSTWSVFKIMSLIHSHNKSDSTHLQFMWFSFSFTNITSIWFVINLLKSVNYKNEEIETQSLLTIVYITLWYTICFIIALIRCSFWILAMIICILFIASLFIEYNKESFFKIQRFSSFKSHLFIIILFASTIFLLSFLILSCSIFIIFYSSFSLVILE